MIQPAQVALVKDLLLNAARNQQNVSYPALSSLFPANTSMTDKMDTLEEASKQLADPSIAIYSAVMAKATGVPGSGFFDLINNMKSHVVASVANHNHHQNLTLAEQKEITEQERACVYAHVLVHHP